MRLLGSLFINSRGHYFLKDLVIITMHEVSSNIYLSIGISVILDDLHVPPDELLPGLILWDLVRPGPGPGLEYVSGSGEGGGCSHHE